MSDWWYFVCTQELLASRDSKDRLEDQGDLDHVDLRVRKGEQDGRVLLAVLVLGASTVSLGSLVSKVLSAH